MTMKLRITNEDAHRTAIVETIDFNPNIDADHRVEGSEKTTSKEEIRPGASLDAWIHSGRRVEVTEKQEG